MTNTTAISNMIPLSVPVFRGNELKYVSECVETGWVSSAGAYVNRFEQMITELSGSKHAIACVNGTAALHIALILAGVQMGDEVIVPTLTFIAPINTVRYVNANPVFMDCDDYLNIDANKVRNFCENECTLKDGKLINKKTKATVRALIVVHVFGHPAKMTELKNLSEKYHFKLIEDATESLGSYYTEGYFKGKKTGTIGDYGCYSFNGNKIITTGGGGMLLTQNDDDANRARYLTTQAKDDEIRFIHGDVGYNYRLTNIQSALGCAQLEQLEQVIKTKRYNYSLYKKQLDGFKGLNLLDEPDGTFSNYWYYTLLLPKESTLEKREALFQHLNKEKIQTRPIWELNHRQKPYANFQAYKIEKAQSYFERGLSLPCSIDLSDEQRERVIHTILKYYE